MFSYARLRARLRAVQLESHECALETGKGAGVFVSVACVRRLRGARRPEECLI